MSCPLSTQHTTMPLLFLRANMKTYDPMQGRDKSTRLLLSGGERLLVVVGVCMFSEV